MNGHSTAENDRWRRWLLLTINVNFAAWAVIAAMTNYVGFRPMFLLVELVPIVWASALLFIYRTYRERRIFYLAFIVGAFQLLVILDQLAYYL